jgi:glycosyltransferase involved in cell wall biosynthesis
MRVLYLINAPGQSPTGAGRRTLRLACDRRERGDDVAVCAPPGSGMHAWCAEAGIASIVAPMGAGPASRRELRDAVGRFDPDVVHAMSFLPLVLAGLAGPGTARRGAAGPCLFASILVDPASSEPMDRAHFRTPVRVVRNALIRRYGGRLDAIFAVSETVAGQLRASGVPGRIVPARGSLDVAELRRRAQGLFDRPGGSPLVGTACADLLTFKGVQYLVRAFAQVRERYPNARLLIAGAERPDNDLRAVAFASGVADATDFLGFLDDIAPMMAALDVYVMPSFSEGLNTSALEAQALGIPVVASRAGSLPEAVLDGETGLLVKTGDSDAIADAILRLLGDAELSARMGAAGRARTEAEFDVSVSLATVDAEYRRALDARAARTAGAAREVRP